MSGEKQQAKLYYTIGEVASMLDVNTSNIRYWEKEFTIVKPGKNRRGNRQFTARDIENLRYIQHLVKEKGHTIDGARKLLSQKDNAESGNYNTIKTLEKIRSVLVELKNEL